MKNKRLSFKAITIIFTLLLYQSPNMFSAAETAENIFSGMDNANVILNNLNYNDVRASNTYAKSAIYEVGALGIMKGYGNQTFGLREPLTKEQAIALSYTAASREAEAQKAGEAIDKAKTITNKKTDAQSLWADGYLQLAQKDGLISRQDLADSFNTNLDKLTANSFYRASYVKRQDMAFWIAKTLNIEPVYGQQKIFNNYRDWKNASPLMLPYIEGIIKNNIMNGDGAGHFNPLDVVTREQAAQITKNAENFILPLFNYQKNTGFVEEINSISDTTNNNILKKTFNIPKSNGKLYQINVELVNSQKPIQKNELTGKILNSLEKNIVVYKQNQLGLSNLLNVGDNIEFIVDSNGIVKYVNVVSSSNNIKYIAAEIKNIDPLNLNISISKIFSSTSPNILGIDNISFDIGTSSPNAIYRIKNDVPVYIKNVKEDISKIIPLDTAVLTITNEIVTSINVFDIKNYNAQSGIVNGIVSENNPNLNYIAIYNGKGDYLTTGSQNDNLEKVRLFKYLDKNSTEVFKNYKKAEVEDIEEGDSVYLKVNDSGKVTGISALDTTTVKYGKVISKTSSTIAVQYNDETQQVLDFTNSIPVFKDKQLVSYDNLKDGDQVKLVLKDTRSSIKLKELYIDRESNFISNIYRCLVSYCDQQSNKLVVKNVEKLVNDNWTMPIYKGFESIPMEDDCKIYLKNQEIEKDYINKMLVGKPAYFAVFEDYGGDEHINFISFKDALDLEVPIYNDIISDSTPYVKEFSLSKDINTMNYGSGSIVVKYGRLVDGSSINKDDKAFVVANREIKSGDYFANIINIKEENKNNSIIITRARIKSIVESKSIEVSTFSELKNYEWTFNDFSKTFKINFNTRISDGNGIIGQRDFLGYGENSFVNKSVYILTDGVNALEINSMPYGNTNIKGNIYELSDDENGVISALKIRNVKLFDPNTKLWKDANDSTINILNSTIILKDGTISKVTDIYKNDKIQILKKDDLSTDAYIIMVE